MTPFAQEGVSGSAPRIALIVVAGIDYRYELRRGDQLVATGQLNTERPLEVARSAAIVPA
jgi:hypothetical protein